ncbi:MAG: tetratricopeptide repeat protein, partial [Planctomycetes bacterium]|nr:tetratricopeptide repeat protein [Planctomycetota bacterium]
YTEAAIELERALRYDPRHPDIHRTLASLHWEAGNLERARSHATRALESNPDDAVSHYIRGRYLARNGDHIGAIQDFRTATLCSDFSSRPQIAALCRYHLAAALEEEGYLEAALRQYGSHQRAVAQLDRPPGKQVLPVVEPELQRLADHGHRVVLEAVSEIHQTLGRFAQAAAALEPLIAERSTDLALSLRYARLLLRAKRFHEAIAAVRAIPSDDDEVVALLFDIYRSQGKPQRIVQELRTRLAGRPDNENALLQLANMLLELGRNAEARTELERFLARHPEAAGARLSLVEVLAGAGDWGSAYHVSAAGIELDADTIESLAETLGKVASGQGPLLPATALDLRNVDSVTAYLVARVALDLDRMDEARHWLNRAYELRPHFLPARIALARLLLNRYRYDEALAIAARANDVTPDDLELELILGAVHERLDQAVEAERHYKAAMQLKRSDMRAMFAMAELFRSSGQHLRSQRQLRALIQLDPDHEAAREMLAYVYLGEGKRDAALEEFKELSRRAVNPAVKTRCDALRNYVFTLESDLERFREVLRGGMEEHGSDAVTWLAIADSHNIDREPEERAAAYRNALRDDPHSEDAAVGLVHAARRLLEFEEATRQLETLVRRRPNRFGWRLSSRGGSPGLIDLYWIIQDFDAALGVLDELERRKELPDNWRRLFRVAGIDTLRSAGREEELTAQLTTWIAEADDPRLYRLMLANEHLRREEYDKAAPLLDTEYQKSPDDSRTLTRLVTALTRSGREARAEQLVLDWLARDPDNDNALLLLVGLMLERERFDNAIELLRSRLIDTLDREVFQNRLIAALAQAERFDESLELIETLIDQVDAILATPQNLRARRLVEPLDLDNAMFLPSEPYTADRLQRRMINLRLRLAGTMILAKEFRSARRQLNAWLEDTTDPTERVWYLERIARCLRGEGDEEAASDVIAKALALRPEFPSFNNDVAYGWIDKGLHLEKAEPMIRFAVSRSPRNAAYLDTYGWLLYKRGDFEAATKWLVRAKVANREGDPVIHDHLGDTAWRLSRKEEGIEHWKQAVVIVGQREEERMSDDERRVRDTTPGKINAAQAGDEPVIAALGAPSEAGGDDD